MFTHFNDACLAQFYEVLRERGLRQPNGVGKRCDTHFASSEMRDDRKPVWIGEGTERLAQFVKMNAFRVWLFHIGSPLSWPTIIGRT